MRRVNQTFIHALLNIALRIVFVVIAQPIDFVNKHMHLNQAVLEKSRYDKSIQPHKSIEVVILRVDHKNQGTHTSPWYVQFQIGYRRTC